MSWIQRIFNSNSLNDVQIFTIIPIYIYYEWETTKKIPQDIQFILNVPGKECLKQDNVIAIAVSQRDNVLKKGNMYYLKDCTKIQKLSIYAGNVLTKSEVVQKYKNLKANIDQKIQKFCVNSEQNPYFVSSEKHPHLYKILSIKENSARIQDIGSLFDIEKSISSHIKSLQNESSRKSGKSIDMSKLINFYKDFATLKTNTYDAQKLNNILKEIDIKPIGTKNTDISELFVLKYPEHKADIIKLQSIRNLSWLKEY